MVVLQPMEIYVDSDAKLTLHGLRQYYIKLAPAEKNRKLNDLLDALEFNQVVIFVSKVVRATELNKLLRECNFPSVVVHGRIKQEERIKRFKDFKEFHNRILVTTDVFARGIDIERVNIVINYDFPGDQHTYLHRVGRAGRFGTKGLAISFVSSEDDAKVLEEVQKKFEVDIPELPESINVTDYSTLPACCSRCPFGRHGADLVRCVRSELGATCGCSSRHLNISQISGASSNCTQHAIVLSCGITTLCWP